MALRVPIILSYNTMNIHEMTGATGFFLGNPQPCRQVKVGRIQVESPWPCLSTGATVILINFKIQSSGRAGETGRSTTTIPNNNET